MATVLNSFSRRPVPIAKIILTYLAIAGMVTMSLFICEEAIQTTMFGTWPAQDAQRWDLVLRGTDIIADINQIAKVINNSFGWIQPLAFFAYRSYSRATDFYIQGLNAKVMRNDPKLFVGRTVELSFEIKRSSQLADGAWLLTHGRLGVIVDQAPTLGVQQSFTGRLDRFENRYVIDLRGQT